MRCEFFAAFPNHGHGLERVQETVLASKAEGTIRTYLADFKRWKPSVLSNGFCHMPANTFHVAVYLQCLILKWILLLLHLMLFTVLTGLNAWLVCKGFLTLSFLPWIAQDRPISWRGVCCNRVVESRRRFSDTLLPQRLILMRICRGLELYRLLDLLPKSGVKTRATAEPGRSLRTLLRTYQTFPVYVFSLRAGGANAAANAGINDRHFKRMVFGWVKMLKNVMIDNFKSLLSISKSLGTC